MKHLFIRHLLAGLLLLPFLLKGQGFDAAYSIRYNTGLATSKIEPAANGFRQQLAHSTALELELRRSDHLGWLIGFYFEGIEIGKSSVFVGDAVEPFNMIHPYSSRLSSVYLRLGVQYNFRILEGDLSLGLLAGPGAVNYSRDWNVLNILVIEGNIIRDNPAFTTFTDESTATFRLQAAARLQYTYWFTPALAFSAGLEYNQSHYISGGIETLRGERYEIKDQEFFPGGAPGRVSPLIYNINYDRTTQMPDPSPVIHQFQFTLGLTCRLISL